MSVLGDGCLSESIRFLEFGNHTIITYNAEFYIIITS
jgi:hypothetical protein